MRSVTVEKRWQRSPKFRRIVIRWAVADAGRVVALFTSLATAKRYAEGWRDAKVNR